MRERAAIASVLGLGLAIPVLAAAGATARAIPEWGFGAWATGSLLAAAIVVLVLRGRRRLPPSLDGAVRRHPVRAGLWSLLAIVALLLLARLGAFIADPSNTWGSLVPNRDVAHHICMTAYVYAADLSRRGEPNVYDERHWPAFRGAADGAPPRSDVAELDEWIEDAYEYPPPFLLIPRLGLLATRHFLVLRAAWFAILTWLLIGVGLSLARWIGGREGLVVGLLLPALVASVPALLNLQIGQAHLFVFALSVGALVAFDRGRGAIGGALLGAATLFKIFPGLLVVYLALQRRWRDLAWTIAAMIALTAIALAALGPAPFVAFVRYQMPRVASGAAFSFFLGSATAVAGNFSVPGIVFKLDALGVPGMSARVASAVGWLYSLVLLGLVARAARRAGDRDRLAEAAVWLGLLNLASLRSPFAPNGYTTLGALWLLTLVAARARRARDVVLIVLAWIAIPGGPPLPSVTLDIAVRTVGQLAMIGLSSYAVWRADAYGARKAVGVAAIG